MKDRVRAVLAGYVLARTGDRLTLRPSWAAGTTFGLALLCAALIVGGVGLQLYLRPPQTEGVTVDESATVRGCAVAAVLAGLAVGGVLVYRQTPITIDRTDHSARHGPRRFGRVEGVYLQAVRRPDGDAYTLFLRITGRPARAAGWGSHREPMQHLSAKVASFLGLEWLQGPGRPN